MATLCFIHILVDRQNAPEVVIESSAGAFLILVDLMDGRITSGLPVRTRLSRWRGGWIVVV